MTNKEIQYELVESVITLNHYLDEMKKGNKIGDKNYDKDAIETVRDRLTKIFNDAKEKEREAK